MKLGTVWTIGGMSLPERVRRSRQALLRAVAHRLPRSIAYWSFIDTGARHIGVSEAVPDVRYVDLLQRAGAAS